jgi:GNAT superfamily N-acetyltransferase
VAPAQLLEARPRLDLLVVDEAAGLPVHTLLALAALAPRAIFATTTAGFEGSGRGFRLRFLEALRQRGGELREFRLERPVRWPSGDPLEDWVNRLFLLNAEAAAPGDLHPGSVRWLSGEWLAADERRLAAVVGLLSDAHYRTRPSDLQRWLDGRGVHIGLLETVGGGPLLGVLLAQAEPGLDAGLARAVWGGERRPPGHFLPCVLAGHGALDAARRPALRVVRIAVQPRWQRRGLGRRLLRAARGFARRQGFGMIGASFGARPDLLRFWNGAGFRALRVGFRRETTSGLHAAVVLLGLQAGARGNWMRCGAGSPPTGRSGARGRCKISIGIRPKRWSVIFPRRELPIRLQTPGRFAPSPAPGVRSNWRCPRCAVGSMPIRASWAGWRRRMQPCCRRWSWDRATGRSSRHWPASPAAPGSFGRCGRPWGEHCRPRTPTRTVGRQSLAAAGDWAGRVGMGMPTYG